MFLKQRENQITWEKPTEISHSTITSVWLLFRVSDFWHVSSRSPSYPMRVWRDMRVSDHCHVTELNRILLYPSEQRNNATATEEQTVRITWWMFGTRSQMRNSTHFCTRWIWHLAEDFFLMVQCFNFTSLNVFLKISKVLEKTERCSPVLLHCNPGTF